MKKLLLAVFFSAIIPQLLPAQGKDYKVVFDITSNDVAQHEKVLRWVKAIAKDYPDSQTEIVFYGHSLDLVTKNKSVDENSVIDLAKNKNIRFRVCQVAMKKHDVQTSDLISGVEPVPDGIYEIVKKQHDGWGYIKVTD